MPLELITVTTGDDVELDGAWYRPPQTIRRRAASILVIHGLTWNFYRGPSRWLPPLLAVSGYMCLALNMRDHDRDEVKDFEHSHNDIAAGVAFLESHGPGEVVLLGHGYACNKLLCYPNLSGDQRPFRRVLATLGAVRAYQPDIWEKVLASAAEIRGPTLVVQGAADHLIEADQRADELFRAARGASMEAVHLDGADHYFNGRHDALAGCVIEWLKRTEQGRT